MYTSLKLSFMLELSKYSSVLKRNEWMVAKSDFLIFYVNVGFGGAYQALEQAKRSGKEHINLGALGQL